MRTIGLKIKEKPIVKAQAPKEEPTKAVEKK